MCCCARYLWQPRLLVHTFDTGGPALRQPGPHAAAVLDVQVCRSWGLKLCMYSCVAAAACCCLPVHDHLCCQVLHAGLLPGRQHRTDTPE